MWVVVSDGRVSGWAMTRAMNGRGQGATGQGAAPGRGDDDGGCQERAVSVVVDDSGMP